MSWNWLRNVLQGAMPKPGDGWNTWECPGCKETLMQPEGVAAFECSVGQPCGNCEPKKTRAALDRTSALLATGCPERYARCVYQEPATWPRVANRPGIDLATWRGEPWCVTFFGISRGGKTAMATELFARNLGAAKSAVWIAAADAVRVIYRGDEDEAERLETCDLLLVDDLGLGHSGNTWGALANLLAARHRGVRRTLVTTNRPLRGNSKTKPPVLGLVDEHPPLYSRIVEDAAVVYFKTAWTAPAQGGAA